MGLNASKVYAPTPDQSSTTGAVAVAPTGTTGPTDAKTAMASPWVSSGYVSEDGLTISVSKSTTAIKDWSKSTVRSILSDYDGTLSLSFLQIDEFAAQRVFGVSNVTKTAATTTAGEQLKVAIGNQLPPEESWCFSMKDGNRRVRVYVPRGQVTEIGDIEFKPDAGQVIGGTISTYDDGTGHSIYVFWDDGEVASA